MNNEQQATRTNNNQPSNADNRSSITSNYELPVTSTQKTIDTPTQIIIPETQLKINSIIYPLTPGKNVYDAMAELSQVSSQPFIFSTKNYPGMGQFVEEINGIKNDFKQNKYWIYYINNKSAIAGISQYIIQQGDIIEWKYE